MNKVSYFVKEVISFLLMLAVMFIVVKGVYAYIVEPFAVDGPSMEYSLHDGERMFMFKQAEIERFDVIVFPDPLSLEKKAILEETDPQAAKETEVPLYIKRVIGVPGDTIAYSDGVLFINGQEVNEPYLDEKEAEIEGDFTNDFELRNVTGEDVVPEGKLFVLGDNRRNSVDGRTFGFIDQDTVIGEANAVYWPLNQIRLLDQYNLSEDGSAIVIE